MENGDSLWRPLKREKLNGKEEEQTKSATFRKKKKRKM